MYVFRNLTEVRELTESLMTEYNDERPLNSLEDLTPSEYLAKHQRAENSRQRCNCQGCSQQQPILFQPVLG